MYVCVCGGGGGGWECGMLSLCKDPPSAPHFSAHNDGVLGPVLSNDYNDTVEER